MTDGPDRAASRRRYDRIATEYDRDAGQESGRFSRIVEGARKRAVAALQLEPGQTVLDVGCGTGASLSRLVAGVGATGRVVGVDQSPGMLGVAAKRIEAAGWTNVERIEAPVEEAKLPPTDAALFFFTHDLLRTPAAIDNVVRAVRPGGRVACAGQRRPSHWLLRLLVPTRRLMRRYVTTREGLDRPWDLLAARLDEVTSAPVLLGALYVVSGVVRAGGQG
jgi:ubiquinone/menaquinone biosynthesis C-methylase UbiE